MPPIRVANLSVFKNVDAGQDETFADVNKAANEIRQAHQCLRTHCDDVSPLTLSSCKSFSSNMLCARLSSASYWFSHHTNELP